MCHRKTGPLRCLLHTHLDLLCGLLALADLLTRKPDRKKANPRLICGHRVISVQWSCRLAAQQHAVEAAACTAAVLKAGFENVLKSMGRTHLCG